MVVDLLLLAAGLAGLVAGGEALVRGAVALARRAGLSPMVIGLTLVGFGTSAPELVTSLQAALAGAPGIAIGNVVGSNIANVLLILGVAAALAPIAVDPASLRRDGAVLAAATVLCIAVVLTGAIGRVEGGVLLAGLGAFLWLAFRAAPAIPAVETAVPEVVPRGPARALGQFAAGLVLTIAGARALVSGAVGIAQAAGVSDAIIGLTVVAVGTSLPELVTSVTAARRGHAEVALGNVIGSNIFNILGILGVTALVAPMAVPAQVAGFDIWAMAAATVLLIVLAATGLRVSRREGAGLLAAYAAYLAVLVVIA